MIHALLLAVALSADPTVRIDGPTEAVAGGVAEFHVSLTGIRKAIVRCNPQPDALKHFRDGDHVVIWLQARTPGNYSLRLTASSPDGGLGEDIVTVKFVPPVNTTPVTPAPTMAAMPAAHDGDSERPQDTRSLATNLAREIETDSPKKEAQIVADVMRAARGEVEAMRIDNPDELVRYTARGVALKLGAKSWQEWREVFFVPYQQHLDELAAQGQLGIMQNYEDVWLEAAKGLERFAGR